MRLIARPTGPVLDLDDPGLQLTRAQREALAFDREVVVTAGAGAGKTHTLSLRYVVLLLHLACEAVRSGTRPDIESVLVLTFTDKAAEEMAERCYKRLLSLSDAVRDRSAELDAICGERFGQHLQSAFEHLLDTFSRARIGTFHGFCARTLQEFPAETGSPPGFDVLDQEAATQHIAEVSEGAVRHFLAHDDGAATLLRTFRTHRALCAAVERVLAKRGTLLDSVRRHRGGPLSPATLEPYARIRPEVARHFLETEGAPALRALVRLVEPSGGGRHLRQVIRPLVERLTDLPSDPLALAGVYLEVLDALIARSGKLRTLTHSSIAGSNSRWPPGLLQRMRPLLQRLEERCEDWPVRRAQARGTPTSADAAMLEVLAPLARLLDHAADELASRYAAIGALDFEELQSRAVDAIERVDDIARTLRARHRYLMIDEFQDTDHRQWAFTLRVGRAPDAPRDRIFLVGDVKQSIYRFRGGDVTVFRRGIVAVDGSPIVLAENFRSDPRLIDWFNTFFHRTMGSPSPSRPDWEAGYEPAVAGRPTSGGSVTLLVHEEVGAHASAIREAEALGALLTGEILPSLGAYRGLDLLDLRAHPTPPVAVLVRARTHLPVFEEVLRRQGVPFLVTNGVGFWARSEIVDLVSMLHALAAEDAISLVGALRSPLFGLSDQAIQDLAETPAEQEGTALQTFGRGEVPGGLDEPAERAWALWSDLLEVRDRLPPSEVLRHVLAATGARHAHTYADPSGQAHANAEQLISLVARLEVQSGAGLRDVAQYCLARVESDAREGEAATPVSTARVVLMTVHAAKGLEFPVVVVPGLAENRPTATGDIVAGVVDDHWLAACRAPDPTSPVQRTGRPGLFTQIDDARRREEDAESLRLLYVACTRARDHLILLGSTHIPRSRQQEPGAPQRHTWMQHLMSVHGAPPRPSELLTVRHVDEITHPDAEALPTHRLGEQAPLPPGPIGPVPFDEVVEVSPSGLQRYQNDPDTWYRTHVLGIPDVATRGFEGIVLAGARGDVIHGLLEDDLADDETAAVQRWRARAFTEGATPEQVEAGIPSLLAHLERTASDARIAQRLTAPGYPELTFRLVRGPILLLGQIDRLWFDRESREWVVLDWKSERIRPEGDESTSDALDRAARHHATQLLAYAWAASEVLCGHGHPPVRRCELYFTATGTLYELTPWTAEDFDGFEALLDEVATFAQQPWSVIRKTSHPDPPPTHMSTPLPPEPTSGWNTPVLPQTPTAPPVETLPPEPVASTPAPPPARTEQPPKRQSRKSTPKRNRRVRTDPNQLTFSFIVAPETDET